MDTWKILPLILLPIIVYKFEFTVHSLGRKGQSSIINYCIAVVCTTAILSGLSQINILPSPPSDQNPSPPQFLMPVFSVIYCPTYYEVEHRPNFEPGQLDKEKKCTGGHPGFAGLLEKCVEVQPRTVKAKFGRTPPHPPPTSPTNDDDKDGTQIQIL